MGMAKPFSETLQKLYDNMLGFLSRLDSAVEEAPLERTKKAMDCIKTALQDLKKNLIGTEFNDEEEEIHFFKHIKPSFHHLLIYHRAIFDIELKLPAGSGKTKRKYYDRHLRRLDHFFQQHADFYVYYRSGEIALDPLYFKREADNPELDPVFSTPQDRLLSQLLANEKLQRWVEKAKANLNAGTEKDRKSVV